MTQPQHDSRALRNALGRYATGVTIVTAIDPEGHPIGLTVNSFAAVSLEPALVLWCLDNNSHNLEAFRKASHHAINVSVHRPGRAVQSLRYLAEPTAFAGLALACRALGGAPDLRRRLRKF